MAAIEIRPGWAVVEIADGRKVSGRIGPLRNGDQIKIDALGELSHTIHIAREQITSIIYCTRDEAAARASQARITQAREQKTA